MTAYLENLGTEVQWFFDGVEVLTVAGAAKRLEIGRDRVSRLVRKGRLVKVEGPSRVYVTLQSVLSYDKERKR